MAPPLEQCRFYRLSPIGGGKSETHAFAQNSSSSLLSGKKEVMPRQRRNGGGFAGGSSTLDEARVLGKENSSRQT
jgi:hypothetical protein